VKNYDKSAIVFTIAEGKGRRRLERRKIKTGKDITDFVIKNMTTSWNSQPKVKALTKFSLFNINCNLNSFKKFNKKFLIFE
jgi:hypothetical protein